MTISRTPLRIRFIQFKPDDSVVVEPIICRRQTIEQLQPHLVTFYTGITRSAPRLLAHQQKAMASEKKKQSVTRRMVNQADTLRRQLQRNDLSGLGELLHEGRELKKDLAAGISSEVIDGWYAQARKAGAGGFLVFYTPPEHHEVNARALPQLRRMDFCFEPQGAASFSSTTDCHAHRPASA